MERGIVRFAGSEQTCEKVSSLAAAENIRVSKITGADSAGEALNAPVTGAEIILAAKVISALFGAGTAIISFTIKLRELLNEREAVLVSTVPDRKPLRLERATTDDTIGRYFSGEGRVSS